MAESGKIPRMTSNMHIIWSNGFVLATDESFLDSLTRQVEITQLLHIQYLCVAVVSPEME